MLAVASSAYLCLATLLSLCPPPRAAADPDPGPSKSADKAEWELQAKAQGKNSASNFEVLKELGVEIKSEGETKTKTL